jgi:chorismate synthase
LGEPVFSKLEAELAKAMLSLPASKSFEIGEGLSATLMRGSEHNDGFTLQEGNIMPASNHHGGTQGGISTGLAISFRVGFKPVSTLAMEMETLNKEGQKVKIEAGGRHDPCVLPRAVSIVESMAYLVILDLYMAQKARMTR